jgi:hypothetical protein
LNSGLADSRELWKNKRIKACTGGRLLCGE